MSGEGLRRASSASSRDSALIFQIRNIRQLLSSPYEPIRACWALPKPSHAGGGGGGAASMFSAATSASSTGPRPAPVSLPAALAGFLPPTTVGIAVAGRPLKRRPALPTRAPQPLRQPLDRTQV